MKGKYEKVARVFIEQYNLIKGTHYAFERLKQSIFSNPRYRVPGFEIHQMAFIEGKKRRPIIADLMVMTRLQRRLIVEVVKPQMRQGAVKNRPLSRLIEDIISISSATIRRPQYYISMKVDQGGYVARVFVKKSKAEHLRESARDLEIDETDDWILEKMKKQTGRKPCS